jgi:general secretion pathway protein E
VGCAPCGHTGYGGRTGIFELLVVDDAMRGLVHRRAPEAELTAAALAQGMALMRADGERLVANGTTSRAELLRVTRD